MKASQALEAGSISVARSTKKALKHSSFRAFFVQVRFAYRQKAASDLMAAFLHEIVFVQRPVTFAALGVVQRYHAAAVRAGEPRPLGLEKGL